MRLRSAGRTGTRRGWLRPSRDVGARRVVIAPRRTCLQRLAPTQAMTLMLLVTIRRPDNVVRQNRMFASRRRLRRSLRPDRSGHCPSWPVMRLLNFRNFGGLRHCCDLAADRSHYGGADRVRPPCGSPASLKSRVHERRPRGAQCTICDSTVGAVVLQEAGRRSSPTARQRGLAARPSPCSGSCREIVIPGRRRSTAPRLLRHMCVEPPFGAIVRLETDRPTGSARDRPDGGQFRPANSCGIFLPFMYFWWRWSATTTPNKNRTDRSRPDRRTCSTRL